MNVASTARVRFVVQSTLQLVLCSVPMSSSLMRVRYCCGSCVCVLVGLFLIKIMGKWLQQWYWDCAIKSTRLGQNYSKVILTSDT